jgi:hypothetical protein
VSWDSELEARLRRLYSVERATGSDGPSVTKAGDGFVTEIANKLILTAPARSLTAAGDLPEDMQQRWERASTANPYMTWIQGRFVEAERANHNGAFWSTQDLQFGEMSVRNGPLNWLHQHTTVIGTIADNMLVQPKPIKLPMQAANFAKDSKVLAGTGWNYDLARETWTNNGASFTVEELARAQTGQTLTLGGGHIEVSGLQRPYIAAVSAIWKWIHPDKAHAVEAASAAGNLWYSMECVSREMACHTDGDRQGCGASFPYLTAVTRPNEVCEHIRHRTSARRMVDPAFLGGAVILPPAKPGWGDATAEVMRQAAQLAEQVAPADAKASEWEQLMAGVLKFAAA